MENVNFIPVNSVWISLQKIFLNIFFNELFFKLKEKILKFEF